MHATVRRQLLTCLAAFFVRCISLSRCSRLTALDWTYWRGPESNGICARPDYLTPGVPIGENLLWKRTDCGSRSTPIVMNGKIYFSCTGRTRNASRRRTSRLLERGNGREPSGKIASMSGSSDVPDTRVGWSSVVGDTETGNVYAMGVCGFFQCLDGSDRQTAVEQSLTRRIRTLEHLRWTHQFPGYL